MPLIEISEKNKNQYGGKCVVLQSHIHEKREVKPGEVIEKFGMQFFEAVKCKIVRPYDPALDEDKPDAIASETKQSVVTDEIKLSPKKRKSKK